MERNKIQTPAYEKRSGYGQILQLALPIMIQNLFSAAISSADVIMLNTVGQSAISAASLAVQYTNVLFMVFYGLGSGAAMLCAQYWGKGEVGAIERVEGIALRFSIFFAMLFALPTALIPDLMMRLFTKDAVLIELGAQYLRIVSVSYLCWSISEIYLAVLRSIERVKTSTVLNVSALLLNILLNAVFVFGWLGFPKMGIHGVALATTIARIVQLVLCIAVSAVSKDIKIRIRLIFEKNKVLMQDFIRLSLPALGNDISWSVAFSMYSVVMGHLGTDMVAANSLVVVVRNFGTVMCFGIANASSIRVGKELGAGRFDDAQDSAKKSMRLTIAAGVLGGILIALMSPFVLHYASLTETARGYLKTMLVINTYYIMGAAVNTTLIAGVFRAGGDTKFGFICDTIDMWCYGVPLGFLAAFVWKLPPMVVYFLLCTDEFVKWPWVLKRYKSKKWMKNLIRSEYSSIK